MAYRYPDRPDYPIDLFSGTATYYARYRAGYPESLIDRLLETADLERRDVLVDLACGTGQVAFAFAPHFRTVHAVDQEPEMIEVGREVAAARGIGNVTWTVSPVETIPFAPGSVDMVAIGNAFHRVHRPDVAQAAYQWLRTDGVFAEMGSAGILSGQEVWQSIVVDVMRRWRRSATERPPEERVRTSDEVLAEAGFQMLEHHETEFPMTWTLDEVIGFLFSTSVASKRVLGASAEDFEGDLRSALLQHDPSGSYHATITYFYRVARKAAA